jgi:hypothetical protein
LFTNFASKKSYIGVGSQLRLWRTSDIDEPGPHAYGGGSLTGNSGLAWGHPQGDLLMCLINGCIIKYRPRLISSVVVNNVNADIPSTEAPHRQTVPILGLPPRDSRYDGNLDQLHYGGILSNLAHVFRGSLTSVPSFEHNVFHSHYAGELRPVGVFEPLWDYGPLSWSFMGLTFPLLRIVDKTSQSLDLLQQLDGNFYDGVHYSFVVDTGVGNTADRPTMFVDDLLSSFMDQTGGTWTFGEYDTPFLDTSLWHISRTIENFQWNEFNESDGELRMTYKFTNSRARLDSHKYNYESWLITVSITNEPAKRGPIGSAPVGFGWFFLSPFDPLKIRYSYTPIETWSFDDDGNRLDYHPAPGTFQYNVDGNHVHQFPMTFTTKPSPELLSDGGAALVAFRNLKRHEINAVIVQDDLLNLTPSSFYSSCAAFEKFSQNLRNNNLQNLAKLPDLASLVPDMRLLFKAIINLKSGNLMGVVQFGDFVAETWLAYKFGIEPNLRVIGELNSYNPAIMDRIAKLGDSQVDRVYGSFIFELPDAYFPGTGKCVLTTRSRLDVEWCDTSLFKSILGARSIGLLPDLSGLWDLVPGSFIFSWLFNMSRRYKDLTSEALMLSCRMTNVIHSYTVTGEIDDDILTSLNLVSGRRRFKDKVYVRHVSDLVPTLRESRFDFRLPTSGPGKDLLAALGWILFRAE